MRLKSVFAVCLLLSLAVLPLPSTAAEAAESDAVRSALDRFFAAAAQKDWGAIDGLLAADFEFYSDDLLELDRSAFLAAMKDDSMEIAKLELQDVSIRVSPDGQMAFVRYKANLESTIQGEPYNMKSAETVVMRKEGKIWRMVHNHASIRKL